MMYGQFDKDALEAMDVVREFRLAGKKQEELHSMIKVLQQFQAGNQSPAVPQAIECIRMELARRQADERHKAEMDQSVKLQLAVQKLQVPHWTLTPTFWISLGVLIVSLAILIVSVLGWLFPMEKAQNAPIAAPVGIAGNSPRQLSNSTLGPPVQQQKSALERAATQGTNRPAK